jgi:hypothetical protein
VATPPQMPAVTYRLTRRQRLYQLYWGIVLTPIGIALLVQGSSGGADSKGLVVGGVGLLLLGIFGLANWNAHTIIDAEGVRTSAEYGRHSCPWSEVRDITCKIDGNDGPIVSRIKVHRKAGRSFTPPAPTDSSTKGNQNPDFGLQFLTIRSYWERTHGPQPLSRPSDSAH